MVSETDIIIILIYLSCEIITFPIYAYSLILISLQLEVVCHLIFQTMNSALWNSQSFTKSGHKDIGI